MKNLYVRPGRVIRVHGSMYTKPNMFNLNWQHRYFIFNEGGHGFTFHIAPRWSVPLRVYIAGWVLMYHWVHGWSWHRFGSDSKWSGISKQNEQSGAPSVPRITGTDPTE